MVQLDMTAYRAPGDTLSVGFVTNDTDPALNQFAMDVYTAYVPGLQVNSGPLSAGTSDHRSFFQNGFPACFPFEDLGQYSPYIHTANDISGVSANDFQLAEMITQGALATVAELARPVSMSMAHVPLGDTQNETGPYVAVAEVQSLTAATVSSVELHWRLAGTSSWTTAPMAPTGNPDEWSGGIPGQVSPARVEYWIEATDSAGHVRWLPESISGGDAFYDFSVGVLTVVLFDDFDGPSDNGWTHAQLSTQDDWQRGPVYGKAGDPGSAFSGPNCWGNDLGPSGWNGEYKPNVNNYLETPGIDCSGRVGMRMRFMRWLTVEESTYDVARILVNGVEVWRNPANGHVIDSGWTADGPGHLAVRGREPERGRALPAAVRRRAGVRRLEPRRLRALRAGAGAAAEHRHRGPHRRHRRPGR